MLNWLKLILIGRPVCEHKWVHIASYEQTNTYNGNCIAVTRLLKCEKCGDLKNHKISAYS